MAQLNCIFVDGEKNVQKFWKVWSEEIKRGRENTGTTEIK